MSIEKETMVMKIAVTYADGNIFQHFGKSEEFKVYVCEADKVISSEVVGTDGKGHGALAGLLQGRDIDVLICGGIGGGAQQALAAAGIKLYGGVQGSCDEAVAALLAGKLSYNPSVVCNHHGHGSEGHGCGGSCHQ